MSTPKLDLIFDVDGVLVYPAMRFRDYLNNTHGISPEMTAPFFHGRFRDCVTGRSDLRNELEVNLTRWGWPGTAETFIETWMHVDSTPDPTLLELVGSLRRQGFKCHVASVQERNRANYLRDIVGFKYAFDETFFSCDVGAAKPDPAFYQAVQQRLGKLPNQLMLIDDSPACIEAARRMGWQTFHYQQPTDQAHMIAAIAEFERR
ncbi:HAD-IA family hydrolase [Schlesneria paludicola]|uniref:HAD-IA family hydrolase n=1 Tax=Schlesneria paludicola TaxID=360056 RepID=UPI00029A2079|nr:HAD-IA family hydrolase [Schlesneria paludicola]